MRTSASGNGRKPDEAVRYPDAAVEARARWLAGLPTVFPAGTYWLRYFAFVPVAGPPKVPIA